jgi:hypothetical protein
MDTDLMKFARTAIVLSVTAAALSGCAELVFHSAGGRTYPAKPENCALRVVGTHPGSEYEEIGVISIEGDRSFGAGSYQDPQEFVNAVRPQVCRAGGEVVATEVNGFGIVARGVAFHKAAAAPATASPPPAAVAGCNPICSPGFACSGQTCVPQCNPACGDGECGNDRQCHPKKP